MPKQKLGICVIVISLVLGLNVSFAKASGFESIKITTINVYQVVSDYLITKKDNFLAHLKDWADGRIGVSADIKAPEVKFSPDDYMKLHQDIESYIFPQIEAEDEKINILPGESEAQKAEEGRIRAEEEKRRKLAYVDPGTFCSAEGRYIEIDISSQRLALCNNGNLEGGPYAISSGSSYYPTPIGTFHINSKSLNAYSPKYDLYMPYWNAFVGSLFGIHELPEYANGYKEGQEYLGRAVSHGCVRLGVGPAEIVYNWAPVGTAVIIHN